MTRPRLPVFVGASKGSSDVSTFGHPPATGDEVTSYDTVGLRVFLASGN